MIKVHVALLASIFGLSAATGVALTQAQHPSDASGIFGGSALIAKADADDNDRGGRGRGRWQNGQYNCNNQPPYGQARGRHRNRDNDGDRDDRGDRDDNGNRGNGRWNRNGQYNGQYGQYGQYGYGNCGYNGQYNGQYGQYGQYGQQGNAVVRGVITSVNGSMVTIMQGIGGQTITINDQPALNNQATGRVTVGRYVTAYGYYQGGMFYATRRRSCFSIRV